MQKAFKETGYFFFLPDFFAFFAFFAFLAMFPSVVPRLVQCKSTFDVAWIKTTP